MLTSSTMRISAFPPDAIIETISEPPNVNCGRDEAIHWYGSPDLVANVPFGNGHIVRYAQVHGTYRSGPSNRGDTSSWSFVQVDVTPPQWEPSDLRTELGRLVQVIGQCLSDARDDLTIGGHLGIPPVEGFYPTTGGMSGAVTSGSGSSRGVREASGATLATINGRVGAGLAQVPLVLTAAGRRFLATAGAAKVAVSLTFTPAHGSPVSVNRVVTLRAPLPSGPTGTTGTTGTTATG